MVEINIQEMYKEMNTLQYSLLPNENKANELRKLYEKFYKYLLSYDLNEEKYNLCSLINDYAEKENINEVKDISHCLRKCLNPWSHYKTEKLKDETLNDYFIIFRKIIYSLTGIIQKEDNQINKDFLLSSLTLNSKQEKAVLSTNKITLVNAGPGTGKTFLIVGRILNELSKKNDKKIFALSFTNKASDSLKDKIEEKIFATNLSKFNKNIFSGTIHSFVLKTIEEFYKIFNLNFDFIIIDESELNEIREEFSNDNEIINKYLNENKLLTFDNIINLFLKTIKNNEKFQEFISNYLDEIIVDEAQDLDKSQYEILALLSNYIKHLKLFFVGDQRQNIYAFKGGSLNNILEFFENEKDFSFIELEYSYRCPQNTLSFVNKFQFHDCKNIPLINANNNTGNILKLVEFENMLNEGIWIAELIKSKIDNIAFSDISIIYSNTFYFKNILESLNDFKIPFKVYGGQYFLNKNIKLIRYILNLIYTNNKFALKNIQNSIIKTEIKGDNIDEVLIPLLDMDIQSKKNYKDLRYILIFIKNNQELNKSILDVLSGLSILIESKDILEKEFLDILFELKEIIENDSGLESYEKFKLSFSAMHPKLGRFYLRSDEIVLSEYYQEGKDYITITTIHSAKGLEWNTVIIPGMSQDSFPRYFKYETDKEKEMPNELKKFYVACTRSMQNLYFTRAIKNNFGYTKEKSIFLKDL